jgi:hypothetical protein
MFGKRQLYYLSNYCLWFVELVNQFKRPNIPIKIFEQNYFLLCNRLCFLRVNGRKFCSTFHLFTIFPFQFLASCLLKTSSSLQLNHTQFGPKRLLTDTCLHTFLSANWLLGHCVLLSCPMGLLPSMGNITPSIFAIVTFDTWNKRHYFKFEKLCHWLRHSCLRLTYFLFIYSSLLVC